MSLPPDGPVLPPGRWEPGESVDLPAARPWSAAAPLSSDAPTARGWVGLTPTGFGGDPPALRSVPVPSPARQSPAGLRLRSALTLVLVVAVALGSVAYRLVGSMPGTADLGPDRSALVLPANGAERLPTFVTGRSDPRPGFEESIAPLGTPPAGVPASTSYAFESTQPATDGGSTFIAWSPCRPIHVVVNTDGAPEGFAAAVRAGLGATSAATGLVFVDDGVTDEQPTAHREAFQPTRYGDRWAPVLIAFAGPEIVTSSSEDAIAEAAVVHVQDRHTGEAFYVSGRIYLSTELLRMRDRGHVPAYVPALRHELGHLVGLGHVDDSHQLMYPTMGAPVTFQNGDLAGLAQLGHGDCAPWV